MWMHSETSLKEDLPHEIEPKHFFTFCAELVHRNSVFKLLHKATPCLQIGEPEALHEYIHTFKSDVALLLGVL